MIVKYKSGSAAVVGNENLIITTAHQIQYDYFLSECPIGTIVKLALEVPNKKEILTQNLVSELEPEILFNSHLSREGDAIFITVFKEVLVEGHILFYSDVSEFDTVIIKPKVAFMDSMFQLSPQNISSTTRQLFLHGFHEETIGFMSKDIFIYEAYSLAVKSRIHILISKLYEDCEESQLSNIEKRRSYNQLMGAEYILKNFTSKIKLDTRYKELILHLPIKLSIQQLLRSTEDKCYRKFDRMVNKLQHILSDCHVDIDVKDVYFNEMPVLADFRKQWHSLYKAELSASILESSLSKYIEFSNLTSSLFNYSKEQAQMTGRVYTGHSGSPIISNNYEVVGMVVSSSNSESLGYRYGLRRESIYKITKLDSEQYTRMLY